MDRRPGPRRRPRLRLHPRGGAITENLHGCGFPDAACRTCEATTTPPCCHTPNLCGGPHPDCYDALRAEAIDDAYANGEPDALDLCPEHGQADCICSGPPGYVIALAVPLVELRLPVHRVDDHTHCGRCGTEHGCGRCRR